MQNRLEIIGNIATGKTTLARLFSQELEVLLEDFHNNPFWEAFYVDPAENSFETEVTFTLQHYHQIKTMTRMISRPTICDFSLWLDAAYAEVTLATERLRLYREIHRELTKELQVPHILINVTCDSNVVLKRIRNRGRKQEGAISLSYLDEIQDAIDVQVGSLFEQGVKIIDIDSENLNFAALERDVHTAKRFVLESLSSQDMS